MVNKVILIGRLTADPEVRATPKGTQVANLRIATNSYGGRDEAGNLKEHTEFPTLVLFGRQAEVAGSTESRAHRRFATAARWTQAAVAARFSCAGSKAR